MPPSNTIATTDPKQQHEQNGNGVQKEVMKLERPTTTIVVPPDGGWGWVVSTNDTKKTCSVKLLTHISHFPFSGCCSILYKQCHS